MDNTVEGISIHHFFQIQFSFVISVQSFIYYYTYIGSFLKNYSYPLIITIAIAITCSCSCIVSIQVFYFSLLLNMEKKYNTVLQPWYFDVNTASGFILWKLISLEEIPSGFEHLSSRKRRGKSLKKDHPFLIRTIMRSDRK